METAKTRARTGNLTAALVAVGILELGVNRLGSRLFFPRATSLVGGASLTVNLLSSAGPFLFQLTAVLAFGVLVAALAGLLRRGELYPRAGRFLVIVLALVFAGFSAQTLARGQLPPRYFLYLELSFGFLALVTLSAFVGAPTLGRVKLGLALLTLPGIVHAAAIFVAGWGLGDGGTFLARVGEWAVVLGAAAAPFLLSPRPSDERHRRLPLSVGLSATILFVLGLHYRFDVLEASALYGLRIELPRLGSLAGVCYVVALFGWTFATTELVTDVGGMRLGGYGLILLALGGYDAGSPVELSLSLLGLLALAVGELRAAPYADRTRPRVSTAEWRVFVGRLATSIGDGTDSEGAPPQAVVVEDGEVESSRIQTYRRGYPITLKLLRRRGLLVELDATVGQPGRDPPDGSVERHRRWLARSPEHRLKLARMKTGDATFDQKFSVHGQAPLEDAALRHRVARQQGDGVLTLWIGCAARYHLAHPSVIDEAPVPFAGTVAGAAPVESVVAIFDTLADVVEASLPAAG